MTKEPLLQPRQPEDPGEPDKHRGNGSLVKGGLVTAMGTWDMGQVHL